MNDIRFRVWDKSENWMDDVGEISWACDGSINYINRTETKDLVLMRYSGLLDKHGTEICESDIIELVDDTGSTIRVVCEFGTAQRVIHGSRVDITGFYFRRLCDSKKTFPIVNNYAGKHDLELFEIIGNIYEDTALWQE